MNRWIEQFSALGQEDRLSIFRLLVRAGPQGNCVDEIKRRLKIPASTLSHHLDVLTRSRLLNAKRWGRFIYYAVNWSEVAALIRFLTEDCCAEMHTGIASAAAAAGGEGACCPQETTGPSARRRRPRPLNS
jgi:ArsR family transcriptional regulator, arsenate/arsenite/antimonite-responsive transcriptional repressor